MVDLAHELMDFSQREITVRPSDIFPEINLEEVKRRFEHLSTGQNHQTVFRVARELWNGGYNEVLDSSGFWDGKYSKFSGHCHQCTPALGVVLKSLGFRDVSYLECRRIEHGFLNSGKIVPVSPDEEPNPEMKKKFQEIGRIPYCCLEVKVEGEPFYLTGKHLKPQGDGSVALLSSECYRPFVGVFRHQDDEIRSGIYLANVLPKRNSKGINFNEFVVWKKQTERDPAPEFFATYLRMNLSD